MKLTLEHVYYLTGAFLLIFSLFTAVDKKHNKRWGTAAFWFLYGVTFLAGTKLTDEVVGGMVVLMAAIVACKQMGSGSYNEASREERQARADKFGNRLFIPALLVGLITLLVAKFTTLGALVGLGIGAVVALLLTLGLTREKPLQTCNEGRRLIDAIGWAAILSQLLAALGYLFDKAGVGQVVAGIVSSIVPSESALAAVIAYCLGMMLFTMIMGNAFAAFAVITSGIGLPLVIKVHGADPAIAGVIAMLAGFCGTLITPMAANFNVVPAALLEMVNKNGVIRAQVMMALPLICVNILLMYFLALPGGR
ncbi:DUF979 domain-containing protein [Azotosporobacter soli]|uniref:DUF979 domain-containing protein n=1 Tax=Azotosporobacter soli TaxID=3055040 RepID=UPI0031FF22C5